MKEDVTRIRPCRAAAIARRANQPETLQGRSPGQGCPSFPDSDTRLSGAMSARECRTVERTRGTGDLLGPVPAPLQPHLAGPRRRRTGPDGAERLDLPAQMLTRYGASARRSYDYRGMCGRRLRVFAIDLVPELVCTGRAHEEVGAQSTRKPSRCRIACNRRTRSPRKKSGRRCRIGAEVFVAGVNGRPRGHPKE